MIVSDWIQLGICTVAVIGIGINIFSIRKQTRYQLFKDRVELFTNISDYLNRYKNTILKLDLKNYEAEFVSGFLDESSPLLLENIFGRNSETVIKTMRITGGNVEKDIFNKLEKIKADSIKCSLLFDKEYIKTIEAFVFGYYDFLDTLYNYKIASEQHIGLEGVGEYLSLTPKAKELKKKYQKFIDIDAIEKMKKDIVLCKKSIFYRAITSFRIWKKEVKNKGEKK